MLFDKFVEETKNWWSGYLLQVSKGLKEGALRVRPVESSDGGLTLIAKKVLFPNMLIVTNCAGYYVAELVGAVENYTGLTVKRHKETSIYRYFSQFDDARPAPAFSFAGSNCGISAACIAQTEELDSLSERFPHLELYETKFLRKGGHGSPIEFTDGFKSGALENCLLVNSKGSLKRCKGILYLAVVKNSVSAAELKELYNMSSSSGRAVAVHTVRENEERIVIGGQLQNMVLFPSLHETTIGKFLELHPDVVRVAFNSKSVLYETSMTWEEHDGTCDDVAIRPDLLVQRDDGFYDIYDLKTALMDRSKITKAARKRRRFIDYVEEGISQLANYREYFSYPKNAALAMEKYGVKVKDPKLVLVVGSWENVDPVEVEQACRKYGGDVQVIDYDTVCQMFIGAAVEGAMSV
ncbi:Shedu anti-phage system protein SduA domain-containing protein [Pseudomonas putida]|uniref:Shedu anti-phage system protein SduA domain-containing protein n=1 Tax=Pseudomonas putida TaxID=303 RepID=UPI002363DBA4|nr:hypothetical protein [Pseudomonas putida]MDD2145310.1 hypothetical protein [Pseudomonas putida]HDS1709451.1 DUF4263 domain-containing protein [Pseudomonas putida]